MDVSDAALVAKCRHGDAAAWEMLVTRYRRLIYTIPRRAGLDEHLAAEVFQCVFQRLVEHIDRLDQPERLSAWLTTTARRETWRISRRESPVRALVRGGDGDEHDPLDIEDEHALLPDQVLLQLEEQHAVRTGVAALDERCRTLLTLLFYRSTPPPYAEIAATLGTTEGSIGPTRARCLEKLRRLLEKQQS